MKDLVLEWEGREWYEYQNVEVILPNVQGQTYVFGSVYPGEREGEVFICCTNEGILVDHTHIVIRVDEQGQYWIQSETTKFKTFVNCETLILEPRLLKCGDTVFLEDSEMCAYTNARDRQPIFHVKERIVEGSDLEIKDASSDSDIEGEACQAMDELNCDGADSPLDISLVLEKIMSYLPVNDLKHARLVSKKWKNEASKTLEKRGKVSFTFGEDNNPAYSTRVFRYLHEMKELKIKNLHILLSPNGPYQRSVFHDLGEANQLSPGEHREKRIDDIRKLLKSSHNFSTLVLSCERLTPMEVFPFQLIFQELAEKLVELELTFRSSVFPVDLPQIPTMTNLKRFTHYGRLGYTLNPRWVSYFVPLFSNTLEHFTTCSNDMAEAYIEEFQNHPMHNLKGIAIKDYVSVSTLSALLELETPLSSLEILYSQPCSELEELLERLLVKHSKSLQLLVLRIGNDSFDDRETKVNFPPFPKLQELEVEYDSRTRIRWGNETSLDYEDHFPCLRKLTVRPRQPWRDDDHVFNSFFRTRDLRCETVTELWIPVLPNPMLPRYLLYVPFVQFQRRMSQIRKMFLNAGKINFFK